MFGLFKRKEPEVEKRAVAMGYTADLIAARHEWLSGTSGVGELTSTVQSCVSLWEGAFALADIDGTRLMTRRNLAMFARSIALRGESVFVIRDDRLLPATDWDLSTRDGRPRAYRVSISEVGGGRSETLLAAEVLHVAVGSSPAAPWAGTSPLHRASLSAGLLQAVETALSEVYREAPIGSQIVPFPETHEDDLASLSRDFRGRRGRVLMRESVHVSAAGGPAPAQDWRPASMTPDISGVRPGESLQAARAGVLSAYGVLPALFADSAQGPLVREAQRHLCQWTLQPLAMLLAEEATEKLGVPVQIDTLRPVQAFDVGGRSRALSAILDAMARAKEAGLSDAEVNAALTQVNWGPNDNAA
ncbi:phage portal protein [Paracoccus sp. YIM 132242]|uniref:Phage portal protein n=1 Tax=Paracoccus lichenicola TaxID=2665644 RepID=A0A6L6HPE6_9RHOB|nr:phage portal protein [Paracoccus lichenicola]MTD99934.1 phage portal protein [Paracoccus lichenicola]